MNPTGDMPQESEELHLEKVSELTKQIEEMKRVNVMEDVSPEEEKKRQEELNSLRRQRFEISNTDERIGYLNQVVTLLKDWSETENDAEIKIERIYEEWGFVPTEESLDPELKEAIEKIKEDNDFLAEDLE